MNRSYQDSERLHKGRSNPAPLSEVSRNSIPQKDPYIF